LEDLIYWIPKREKVPRSSLIWKTWGSFEKPDAG